MMKKVLIVLIAVMILSQFCVGCNSQADGKAAQSDSAVLKSKLPSNQGVAYSFTLATKKIEVKEGSVLTISGKEIKPEQDIYKVVFSQAVVGKTTIKLSGESLMIISETGYPLLVRVASKADSASSSNKKIKVGSRIIYATKKLTTEAGEVRKYFTTINCGKQFVLLSQMGDAKQQLPSTIKEVLLSLKCEVVK